MSGCASIAYAQSSSIVSREAPDKVTVRAFRVPSPLRIDGRLDEEVYRTVDPISGFIQVQFNVDGRTPTSSARLRWEYTGGSDLFVVYSDGRDTRNLGFPGLLNRTFAIKATRLLRF